MQRIVTDLFRKVIFLFKNKQINIYININNSFNIDGKDHTTNRAGEDNLSKKKTLSFRHLLDEFGIKRS